MAFWKLVHYWFYQNSVSNISLKLISIFVTYLLQYGWIYFLTKYPICITIFLLRTTKCLNLPPGKNFPMIPNRAHLCCITHKRKNKTKTQKQKITRKRNENEIHSLAWDRYLQDVFSLHCKQIKEDRLWDSEFLTNAGCVVKFLISLNNYLTIIILTQVCKSKHFALPFFHFWPRCNLQAFSFGEIPSEIFWSVSLL